MYAEHMYVPGMHMGATPKSAEAREPASACSLTVGDS
jgi:hypothetical protein